jgi:hypothetical protein
MAGIKKQSALTVIVVVRGEKSLDPSCQRAECSSRDGQRTREWTVESQEDERLLRQYRLLNDKNNKILRKPAIFGGVAKCHGALTTAERRWSFDVVLRLGLASSLVGCRANT